MGAHARAEPGARSGPQSGRSVAQAIGTGSPSTQVPRTSRGAPLSTELPRSTRSVGIAAASRPPDNWYQAQLDHREMAHRWVTGATVGGGLYRSVYHGGERHGLARERDERREDGGSGYPDVCR